MKKVMLLFYEMKIGALKRQRQNVTVSNSTNAGPRTKILLINNWKIYELITPYLSACKYTRQTTKPRLPKIWPGQEHYSKKKEHRDHIRALDIPTHQVVLQEVGAVIELHPKRKLNKPFAQSARD